MAVQSSDNRSQPAPDGSRIQLFVDGQPVGVPADGSNPSFISGGLPGFGEAAADTIEDENAPTRKLSPREEALLRMIASLGIPGMPTVPLSEDTQSPERTPMQRYLTEAAEAAAARQVQAAMDAARQATDLPPLPGDLQPIAEELLFRSLVEAAAQAAMDHGQSERPANTSAMRTQRLTESDIEALREALEVYRTESNK
jgi:hypothetical protein